MAVETKRTFCRACHASCALEVDVEDGRVLAVRGDPADPVYGRFTCIKGRQLPEQHSHPDRLRSSLKRAASGSFEPIGSEQALDEIAERLSAIIERCGPRAVASYNGTRGQHSRDVVRAWHHGIASPSYYTSSSIDQPAKFFVAPARHGLWAAGMHGFESADVVMMIGVNPLVSMYSGTDGGLSWVNPFKRLRDARRRGLKVICVDPRYTELARRSDLHLQIEPGEDPALLCGMLRVIFAEGLYDRDFCEEHADGFEALRDAVSDFTPELVERRTGVPAALMLEAARLFGRGPRGAVTSGTGTNMAPHPNLAEHLILALNTVCGRYNREGDVAPHPKILAPPAPRRAQAIAPWGDFAGGVRSRVRGLGVLRASPLDAGQMPTAALADEILTPGEGQIRALITVGGNPVMAWPNQPKVRRALESLELFVSIDSNLSASARLADFVIAPKLCLERADVTRSDGSFTAPYGNYTEVIVEPDFDVIEEWEFFWGLARRMETPIALRGGELPLDRKPTAHEVLQTTSAGARISVDELRAQDGGHVFDEIEVIVEPREDGHSARLQLAPDGIVEEIRAVLQDPARGDGGGGAAGGRYTHRLICRRLVHSYNSSGHELPGARAQGSTNPAFMSRADLTELGLASGDLIEIRSAHGAIPAVVEATDELGSGVISMAHAWGDLPERDDEVREIGSSTNRLVDDESDFDPLSGMARQSAIPVSVRPLAQRERVATQPPPRR